MTELMNFQGPVPTTPIGEEQIAEEIPDFSGRVTNAPLITPGRSLAWKNTETRSVKNNEGEYEDQTWNELLKRWDAYQTLAKDNEYFRHAPGWAKEERAKIRPVHQALRSLEREYDPENRRFSTSLWGFGTPRYRKNTNMEFSNYWGGKRKTRKRRKKKRKKTRSKSKKRKKTKKCRKTKKRKTRR